MAFLQRYGIFLHSLIVARKNSNHHCKIAVRLADTTSHYVRSGDKIALALLGDGFYAAVIGTHTSGAEYEHNRRQPVALSAAELNAVEADWVNRKAVATSLGA